MAKPMTPSAERKRITEGTIGKLTESLAAALRKVNPFSDEAQLLIDDRWPELKDGLIAANVAVVQRVLDRIRGTITIEVKPEDLVYDLGDGYVKADDFVEGEAGTFSLIGEEFLREGEPHAGGEEMVKRSRKMDSVGTLAQAQALVREQDKIPVEYRGKVVFVFTGAIKRGSGPARFRNVAVVYWFGVRWVLSWYWLVSVFDRIYRVVRVRKSSPPKADWRRLVAGVLGSCSSWSPWIFRFW